MACPVRVYPLRKPKNHRLPVPRYTLTLPDGVDHVYTSYIGVQQHSDDPASAAAKRTVCEYIRTWLLSAHQPASYESFSLLDGREAPGTTVWVCYWADARTHESALAALDLRALHARTPKQQQPAIGLWLEAFATPVARLETNYAGPDYLPGLARLPGSRAAEHELATYWGAARDRIPDSAHDLFPRPAAAERPQDPVGRGQYLTGTSHANLVHIRSGQWWAACGAAEAGAYETKLEPTLRKGLQYLNEHAADTGAMGLRYLRNTDTESPLVDDDRKETCGAGFFANLEDLETWAKTHGSHLAIWRGALAHYKAFPDNRRFRTWHEVSVVEQGRSRFEYVNCTRGTGVMGTTHLEVEELDL
ncbi:heme-containing dehydratase protein [Boeremia exigua]|uniref:heme-containing dehydratase protein n=1 Tax=Boeremia exigua TaxID=749465 RepID=UPI001E8D0A5C|nr:heme-containing dehydratase protein [Boeremia exigua]KAH6637872.1 heme-containing dehydratase protein [Boeremia exigua]